MAPSRTVIAHYALNGQMHSKAQTALVLHHTRMYVQMCYEKNHINCQMWNKHFLIVIYHSSPVKAAMNAARVCILRNGMKKTHQFLLFSQAKEGTKTIAHLSIAEGSSF